MPHLLQPGAGDHSTHRSAAGLPDQANHQPEEGLEGGSGEARAELGKQTGQRARCDGAGEHRRITLTRTVTRSGRCCPPHTPRSTNHASPACPRDPRTSDSSKNCETRGLDTAAPTCGVPEVGYGPLSSGDPHVDTIPTCTPLGTHSLCE